MMTVQIFVGRLFVEIRSNNKTNSVMMGTQLQEMGVLLNACMEYAVMGSLTVDSNVMTGTYKLGMAVMMSAKKKK